jgi:hypothetical protein
VLNFFFFIMWGARLVRPPPPPPPPPRSSPAARFLFFLSLARTWHGVTTMADADVTAEEVELSDDGVRKLPRTVLRAMASGMDVLRRGAKQAAAVLDAVLEARAAAARDARGKGPAAAEGAVESGASGTATGAPATAPAPVDAAKELAALDATVAALAERLEAVETTEQPLPLDLQAERRYPTLALGNVRSQREWDALRGIAMALFRA